MLLKIIHPKWKIPKKLAISRRKNTDIQNPRIVRVEWSAGQVVGEFWGRLLTGVLVEQHYVELNFTFLKAFAIWDAP